MLELTFAVTPRSDNAEFFLALEAAKKNARDKLFDDVLTTLSRFFAESRICISSGEKTDFKLAVWSRRRHS